MMDLGPKMGSSSFARFARLAAVVVLIELAVPGLAAAQAVSETERAALVKMRTDRGGQAQEVDALIQLASDADAEGLPAVPLVNKIREGLAKGVEPARIEVVIRRMTADLETADRLIRELRPLSGGAGMDASVTLLAEAIGSGVTTDEVSDLGRIQPSSGAPPLATTTPEGLASAAKGLSFIKEAQLSGAPVIAEAVRQGFRSSELLELGREVKRREADYRAGRASLEALRDAIARGERPERLFDAPGADIERPAAARPEPIERPTRPATPERPERPVRPDRPATPGR